MNITPKPIPDLAGIAAWFTPGRFAALLGLLLFVTFPEVVLGLETFAIRDYPMFGYPLAHYLRESLLAGELPHWNPFSSCGIPFLAQWNTMCIYPPVLLYVFTPLTWGLPVFMLLHQFAGGVGMYWVARQWTGNDFAAAFAGVAYAFNGLVLCCLMWPNNMAAFGWLPWVILLVERGSRSGGRALVAGALAAGLQLLTGAPEVILATWVLAGLASLFRKPADWRAWRQRGLRLGLMSALAAGVAAIQLLPFLRLIANAQRTTDFASSAWSMPVWGWADFLVPRFLTPMSDLGIVYQSDQGWTSSYYAGILTLTLALLAVTRLCSRWTLLLAATAAACTWLAMGDAGGLYRCLRTIVPWAGLVRFPVKAIIPCSFLLPALAAYGLAWWYAGRQPAAGWGKYWPELVVVLGVVLLTLVVGITGSLFAAGPVEGPAVMVNAATRVLFLAGGFGLLLMADRLRARIHWLLVLVPILGWWDARSHVPTQNPTVSPDVFRIDLRELQAPCRLGQDRMFISPPARHKLRNRGVPDPVDSCLRARVIGVDNVNLLERRATIDGFYSLYPMPMHRIWNWLVQNRNYQNPQALDFMGVRYTTDDRKPGERRERANPMPLISIGQKPLCDDPRVTFYAFQDPAFDPRRITILPTEAEATLKAQPSPSARILNTDWQTHRIRIDIASPTPALLVIAQADYPGWQATIDGRTAPILRANYAFQALDVPAGRHIVTLRYVDTSLQVGAAISVVALAVLALVWYRHRPSAGQGARGTGKPA